MRFSPILLLHICGGTLGVISGFVAVFLRKGSRRHALAGTVFVISIMALAASGAFMAILKSQAGNILAGTLTFYLVATSWRTVKRKQGNPGLVDWIALLVAAAIASVTLPWAFEAATSQTGLKNGIPTGPYAVFGSVALLSTIGDARMIARRGISGVPRIARHLWRMCFAFFVASASLFLARAHLFPAIMRQTGALYFLSFLPLILMIFWLIRIRFTSAYRKMGLIAPSAERSLSATGLSATGLSGNEMLQSSPGRM
jgi:hypothetical protein